MADYQDEGIRLIDLLWGNLGNWGEHIPYDYEGDDGDGYSKCRHTFDEQITPTVRRLVLFLESDNRAQAARYVGQALDAMAEQCSEMDRWCHGNPVPFEIGVFWPQSIVFNEIDPDLSVWNRCWDVLRDVQTLYEGAKPTDPADTKTDTPKKPKIKRLWNSDAQNCLKDFKAERRLDASIVLKTFVYAWAGERKLSQTGLYKRFTDNPDNWKPADN